MHTEGIELVPFNNLDLSEANWQQNNNLTATDFPQFVWGNFPSGSFSTPALEEPDTAEGMEMEFQWNFPEYTFTFTSRPAHTSDTSEANHSDPLTGDVLSDSEAVLGAAVFQAREQLESFVSDEDFLGELNQAFALDTTSEEAKTLIEDLASGETMPTLEIIAARELNNANAAFGEGTIYLAEEFLSENFNSPEAVEGVLLEEIGHYVDQELGGGDSRGDEGDIFAQLVRDETLSEAELDELQAEDDSATIGIDGEEIDVELDVPPAAPPYPGKAFSYNGEPSVDYNENVELWQEQMEDLGYNLTVDGKYGPESESIAREFQADQGLAVDGILGPNTWEASFAAAPPYPETSFSYNGESSVPYNESVELWQEQMRYLGYDLSVDGKYGPGSESVAREFQADQGLAVDGILGPNTWAASFAAVPETPPEPYDPSGIPLHSNPTESNPLVGFSDPLNGQGTLTRATLVDGVATHNDPDDRNYWAYDYGAPIGTPIYAVASGEVVAVEESFPDFSPNDDGTPNDDERANYVAIKLDDSDGVDDNYQALYVHVQQNSVGVNVGDRVEAGQLIAKTGHNGYSTGPHLHIEVNRRPSSGNVYGQTVPAVLG